MTDIKVTPYRKRILFCGEASFLNTGFSTYYRELLPRLVKTGKYEIAEFGSYANDLDSRIKTFIQGRWKFYGGMPSSDAEQQQFEAANTDPAQPGQQLSQFGRWRFERVVADFRPDIVIDIRDWWMLAYQQRSPLRKYFQWVIMPTVDSVPQKEEWIATYVTADYVACYSDFGIDSLRRTTPHLEVRFNPPGVDVLGHDKLRSIDSTDLTKIKHPGKVHPIPLRPGVDIETFKPMDKHEVRAKWGLKPDNPVIVLVQRNQARKRINEAIQAFALMKERYKGDKNVDKAIMILHTAWPDNAHSSDYPRCIERTHKGYHGMPYHHKNIFAEILNTFLCNNEQCGHVFLAHAIHLREVGPHNNYSIECPQCKQRSGRPTTTAIGYTREQLAEVYNMGDILVQMSIAEGCGMPVQEAKACGTMVLVTDYAAIAEKGGIPERYEHIDKKSYTIQKGGDTLKVDHMRYEPETGCWRADTSIEDTADKMARYLMNEPLLRQKQAEARECALTNYDWDQLATRWEFILDKKSIHNRAETWDKPAALIEIDMEDPSPEMPDDEFVDWCYTNLLGYAPDAIDEKGKSDWLRTIELHRQHGKPDHEARKTIMEFFRNEANNINNVERLRAGLEPTGLGEDEPNEESSDTVSVLVLM